MAKQLNYPLETRQKPLVIFHFTCLQYAECKRSSLSFWNVYLLKTNLFRLTKTDNIINSIVYKSQKNIKVTFGLLFIIWRHK